MSNKLLVIIGNTIPYVKEIREKCGSVTACILMQQLEYRFNKSPNGFFKFLSPCDKKAYKKGDSWCEELAFSEDEFRTAFSKIGIAYKSKNLFEKDEDSFKNMFYCSYFDKIKGLTFYFRNDELVDKYLNSIVVLSDPIPQTEIKIAKIRKPTKAIYVNGQSQFTETDKGNIHTYSTDNTTDNTTESKSEKEFSQPLPPVVEIQNLIEVELSHPDEVNDDLINQPKGEIKENTPQVPPTPLKEKGFMVYSQNEFEENLMNLFSDPMHKEDLKNKLKKYGYSENGIISRKQADVIFSVFSDWLLKEKDPDNFIHYFSPSKVKRDFLSALSWIISKEVVKNAFKKPFQNSEKPNYAPSNEKPRYA